MTNADEQRQQERALKRGAFLTLFGILASHAILETARDALFLTHLPPERLPFVYLMVAVAAAALSMGPGLRSAPGQARRRLLLTLGVAAGITLLFALVMTTGLAGSSGLIYYALYVWSGVIATVLIVTFWLTLGDLFTITQGKRLFAPIGTGGAVGAITGYGIATAASAGLATEHLLSLAALAFALTAAGPAFLLRPSGADFVPAGMSSDDEVPGLRECVEKVAGNRYARAVGLLVVLGTVSVTLSDYVFKSTLARSVPPDQLATWVAGIHLGLNAASLFVLAVVVTPVIQRLSLHRALALLPLAMVAAGLSFIVLPGLLTVGLLKGADGALRHSLQKTAQELLYLPLPQELRASVKSFLDIVGHQGARALASLAILGLVALPEATLWLGVAVVLTSVGWAWCSLRLRDPYLEVFRSTLEAGNIETSIQVPELDLASLETLLRALNHPDERQVLAALDILAHRNRVDLIPGLILYHPSTAVVERGLDLFGRAGRDDFLGLTPRLLEHDSALVRAATVRAMASAGADREQLLALAESECPCIKASAIAGLAAQGHLTPEAALPLLRETLHEQGCDARMAIAQAIRAHHAPEYRTLLLELLEDEDPEVRIEAVRAVCASGAASYTPALVMRLGDRAAREQVRRALLERGEEGLEALERALIDADTPVAVLRHIPRTISRFDSQAATDLLLAHLDDDRLAGMVRFKILRGLGALRANPMIRLAPKPLRTAVDHSLERCRNLVQWQEALERGAREDRTRATDCHWLLIELLQDKESLALQRIFRMLYLLHPEENFRWIWEGLQSGHRLERASGAELVENLLPRDVSDAILGLMETGDAAERLRATETPRLRLPYDVVLSQMRSDHSSTLSGLATYHAAELGSEAPETGERRPETSEPQSLLDKAVSLLENLPESAIPALPRRA